jgi:hypothetical protein
MIARKVMTALTDLTQAVDVHGLNFSLRRRAVVQQVVAAERSAARQFVQQRSRAVLVFVAGGVAPVVVDCHLMDSVRRSHSQLRHRLYLMGPKVATQKSSLISAPHPAGDDAELAC